MKEIAIVLRPGVEVGMKLYASITCLRSAGINPRSAVIVRACAIVWVDDEEISLAVDLLRNNDFEAAAVSETDELSRVPARLPCPCLPIESSDRF
jgi:hypothetical protein